MSRYYSLLIFLFTWHTYSQTLPCPQVTSSTQHFCLDDQPTVANLLPQDAVWYSSGTSTTPLSASTPLVSSQFYYADNIDGTCESRPRVRAYVYDDPDAGSDNLGAICDSEVDALFPALYSIENYYKNLLSPGVPRNGTFHPSASQMVTDYHSEPVVGYKDFPRTYTYGAEGCQDSAVITLRVYEDVSAGTDTQITLFSTDPPITMLDSMAGNPSTGGAWSGLESGIFDPAIDSAGVYVYTVENALCGSSTASLTINIEKAGWSLPEAQYGTYSGFTTSNENSVLTRSPRIAVTSMDEIAQNDEIIESITYYDGLGRPLQEVAIRGGGDEEDIITPFVYDNFGRQVQQYLPYAGTSLEGQLHSNPIASVVSFYNRTKYENTPNPYSEMELEASPLSRVFKQAAPGDAWKLGSGHEIEFGYQANTLDEVRMFKVTFDNGDSKDPLLVLDQAGFYAPGELYKTVTRDENHSGSTKNHTTEEFKDKLGRVVLKRTYANVGGDTEVPHDTYYVYDDYGNLTFVLPPKLEGTEDRLADILTNLDHLAYQYKYDHRNRLTEKKIPGKGWEYIIYNILDQTVMTQDQLQREKSPQEWLYTKYDAFGRVTSTGIFTNTSIGTGRESMQEALDNYYNTSTANAYETRNGSNYTNTSFPVQDLEVLIENFYDDYNFDKDGIVIPAKIFNDTIVEQQKLKGLATGSRVKVLGTADFITTVSGYDNKGRNIWTASKNPFLETEDIVEQELDFTGNTIESRTTHQKVGSPFIETRDLYAYDHQNRLISHTQTINEEPEALISYNQYDELGQLYNKWVGGYFNIGDGPLQKVDYAYNIRGWLRKINEPDNLGDNLFGFEISYNDPQNTAATPLFNGNISETHWNSKSENNNNNLVSNSYFYSYDALNRITGAIDNTTNYSLTGVSYDKNGNIMNLSRNGWQDNATFIDMDDLGYNYNGNQLMNVTDAGNKNQGFTEPANTTEDDYAYDSNGNMIRDYNKGITEISYSYLNLPETVKIGDGTIFYIYDATGMKLKKEVNEEGNVTATEYAGKFIYKGGVLEFLSQSEGYIEPKNTADISQGFNYVYQYRDHLGNVRLTYADLNNNGTIEASSEILQELNYYPFGLEHKGYNNVLRGTENNHFTYNGKELEKELGLEWTDYGARRYMRDLGRWASVDPLADKRDWLTPYNFVQNSPMFRIDPDGLTDFKVNKETGEVTRVGEVNDDPDRILKTDNEGNVKKKGEGFLGFLVKKSERGKAKVAIDDISKGIIPEDGFNLKENDHTFQVNQEGQPGLNDVAKFISEFSDHVGKEISGIMSGKPDSPTVLRVKTHKYKDNTATNAKTPVSWLTSGLNFLKRHFHTHPNSSHTPSNDDKQVKRDFPNIKHSIISGGTEEEY